MAAFLSTLFGALVTIAMVIFVERMRRPRLELSIQPPFDGPWAQNAPVRAMRSLRLILSNKTLPWWARSWMSHTPALQCRAEITFHDGTTRQNIFERTMEGRWATSAEPFIIQAPQGRPIMFIPESVCVVYPGEHAVLDIAIRADDDVHSYGWNNESYVCTPEWRNPRWQLRQGIYLVKVVITSSGQKYSRCFSLINQANRDAFHLDHSQQQF
jgi:hypothetical protein